MPMKPLEGLSFLSICIRYKPSIVYSLSINSTTAHRESIPLWTTPSCGSIYRTPKTAYSESISLSSLESLGAFAITCFNRLVKSSAFKDRYLTSSLVTVALYRSVTVWGVPNKRLVVRQLTGDLSALLQKIQHHSSCRPSFVVSLGILRDGLKFSVQCLEQDLS